MILGFIFNDSFRLIFVYSCITVKMNRRTLLLINNLLQSGGQVRVVVLKSRLQSPLRYDFLALSKDHGPLRTQQGVHDKARYRKDGGPPQDPTQFFSEFIVCVESRRDSVEHLWWWGGWSVSRGLQCADNDSCQVWNVDPGKWLSSRSQGTPEAEPEWQQHLLHGPTITTQHCPWGMHGK